MFTLRRRRGILGILKSSFEFYSVLTGYEILLKSGLCILNHEPEFGRDKPVQLNRVEIYDP